MDKIMERYERYNYAERQLDPVNHQESWDMEYPKLVARLDMLQRNMRNYGGEDIDTLSMRELQQMEQQLDAALKRIRNRKNQLMHESISQLQKKEKAMQEHNKMLAKMVKEKETTEAREQVEQQNLGETFMQPSLNSFPYPSLSIGGDYQDNRQLTAEQVNHQSEGRPDINRGMPAWMFRHFAD